MSLEPGKELESALHAVDPSEYIPMLDQIREDQVMMRKFVTHLAMTDPLSFKKAFEGMKGVRVNGRLIDLARVDEACKNGQPITAIKYVREVADIGLKDAKEFVDKRRVFLGLLPQMPY